MSRPQAKAAPGTCRWMARSEETGNRRININGTIYDVTEGPGGIVLSYQRGSTTVRYAIDTSEPAWICDCPDARHRWNRGEGGCKHVRSLRAAYAAIRLEPPCQSS